MTVQDLINSRTERAPKEVKFVLTDKKNKFGSETIGAGGDNRVIFTPAENTFVRVKRMYVKTEFNKFNGGNPQSGLILLIFVENNDPPFIAGTPFRRLHTVTFSGFLDWKGDLEINGKHEHLVVFLNPKNASNSQTTKYAIDYDEFVRTEV